MFSGRDVCKRSGHDSRQKQELQEVLEEWKGVFKKEGPIMSREKTEEIVCLTSERGLEH